MTTNIFLFIIIAITACAGIYIVNFILNSFKYIMGGVAILLMLAMGLTISPNLQNFQLPMNQSGMLSIWSPKNRTLSAPSTTPSNTTTSLNTTTPSNAKSVKDATDILDYVEDGIKYQLIPVSEYKIAIPANVSIIEIDGVEYLKFRVKPHKTLASFL